MPGQMREPGLWLEGFRRCLYTGGHLARWAREGRVQGVAGSLLALERALALGPEYRAFLVSAAGQSPEEALQRLLGEDAKGLVDALEGVEGWVSVPLPCPPTAPADTLTASARDLIARTGRRRVAVQVPPTPEGLKALTALSAEGVPVEAVPVYAAEGVRAVLSAWRRGGAGAPLWVGVPFRPLYLCLGPGQAEAGARHLAQTVQEAGDPRVHLLWRDLAPADPAEGESSLLARLAGVPGLRAVPFSMLLLEPPPPPEAPGPPAPAEVPAPLAEGLLARDLEHLERHRRRLLQRLAQGPAEPAQPLPHEWRQRTEACRAQWEEERVLERLWARDPTLWAHPSAPEVRDCLGWLTLPERMEGVVARVQETAHQAQEEGVERVVLLGMGGSILAPEVLRRVFGPRPGHPDLWVLDTTHPSAVLALARSLDYRRTWFVISSRSGTTVETLSLFAFFWAECARLAEPGPRFLAITAPGSPLVRLAEEHRFREIFLAPPTVGGRFSALSVFGLLPAGLLGVDPLSLLEEAARMMEASTPCTSAREAPPGVLGAFLAETARAGRDKLTLLTSPTLSAFPAWVEQLVAESLGKEGKGIVPVLEEPPLDPSAYRPDRAFVLVTLAGEEEAPARHGRALAEAGHPVLHLRLPRLTALGREFYRWEVAVALAGARLGVYPFNQPDVEGSKERARRGMTQGGAIEPPPDEVRAEGGDLAPALARWLGESREGDYLAVQAFLAPGPEVEPLVWDLVEALRARTGLAVTMGWGPRFLHSTGQLHKGGPNTGLFLQLVDEPPEDAEVPGRGYTFGALIRAQAIGDYEALRQRGRRVLRVNLGRDAGAGLTALLQALAHA